MTGDWHLGGRGRSAPLFERAVVRYVFAIAAVAIAFAVRLLLVPVTGTGAPFVLFFAAVTATSLLAGSGPGILSVALSMPLAAYVFVVGAGYSRSQASVQALLFGVDGLVVVYLTLAVTRARRAAERTNEQLQRANQELAQAAARTREVIDLAPDAFFLADLNGRFTDVNEAACRMLGYDRSELIGKTVLDLIPPGDAPRLEQVRANLTVPGKVSSGEWIQLRKDGTPLAVEVSSTILPGGRWQAFARDIRRRKEQEAEGKRLSAEIEAERLYLQSVLDAVPVGVVLFRPDGTIFVNARGEEALGVKVSPGGGVAQYANRILFPDGTPVPPDQLVSSRVLGRGETITGAEFLVQREDGSRIPILGSAAPIRDALGRMVGAVGVFQDVSERMRTEEAVRRNERLLSAVVGALPVGLSIADERGRFVRQNAAAIEIWGRRREGLSDLALQKGWWANTGERVPLDQWPLFRVLRNGERSAGGLMRIAMPDGREKTIINSALALADEAGTVTGAIALHQDVTQLKETEDALRRAVRSRDEVLGIVAHDLRNPLSNVLLMTELLREKGVEERAVAAIRRAATWMNRLIEDLVDIARLEQGVLSIQTSRFEVRAFVRQVVATQLALASASSIALEADAAGEPREVSADRDRLAQVLENLIGNAVKFTGAGGCIRVGIADRGHEIWFSVGDTGRGIPADSLQHVFDRFRQFDANGKRGAGLGLAIVKGIVEAHGGRVWIESTVGVGTTVFFALPTPARDVTKSPVSGQ